MAGRPWVVWGATAYDPVIWSYYIDLLTANGRERTDFRTIYQDTFYQEWEGGLPSHSHFFGAWVDGGILAGLSWLAVPVLSILAIMQGVAWLHPIVPVFIFVATTTIWHVNVSPGPPRMHTAIRRIMLTFFLPFLVNTRPPPR